jgi:hypothetical protein
LKKLDFIIIPPQALGTIRQHQQKASSDTTDLFILAPLLSRELKSLFSVKSQSVNL